MTYHHIQYSHDGDHTETRASCTAPVGSRCRMTCEHNSCEEYGPVVTDTRGRLWHGTDPFSLNPDGITEQHQMIDSGECNWATWMNEDPSMIPECATRGQRFDFATIDVETEFRDGAWEWRRVQRVSELMSQQFRDAGREIAAGLERGMRSANEAVAEAGFNPVVLGIDPATPIETTARRVRRDGRWVYEPPLVAPRMRGRELRGGWLDEVRAMPPLPNFTATSGGAQFTTVRDAPRFTVINRRKHIPWPVNGD